MHEFINVLELKGTVKNVNWSHSACRQYSNTYYGKPFKTTEWHCARIFAKSGSGVGNVNVVNPRKWKRFCHFGNRKDASISGCGKMLIYVILSSLHNLVAVDSLISISLYFICKKTINLYTDDSFRLPKILEFSTSELCSECAPCWVGNSCINNAKCTWYSLPHACELECE